MECTETNHVFFKGRVEPSKIDKQLVNIGKILGLVPKPGEVTQQFKERLNFALIPETVLGLVTLPGQLTRREYDEHCRRKVVQQHLERAEPEEVTRIDSQYINWGNL